MPQTHRQCPDYLDPEKLIVNKRLYNIFNKITKKLDPSGLCCIATYERLTIVRIISNLLKILFFCNQSDQI
ncbi:hypothetical protein [Wolbachia endosymbiont of Drosophila pseudotakahashii]|uniref:hypothetical protein n=1 Tax=Wolbachia endosymbiont of Drosophila pseudotakahashii TaxID=375919 RepID=UPI00222EE315|nr:hypothetical protein [Wolbachia endosymbiont of Drosophila pseudotakahashii]UZE38872.1 hypothetical protein ONI09_01945 [Wolbachia endosymbiont of Drosophila pseudotakahashii]